MDETLLVCLVDIQIRVFCIPVQSYVTVSVVKCHTGNKCFTWREFEAIWEINLHHDLHQNEAVTRSLWTTIDDLIGNRHF